MDHELEPVGFRRCDAPRDPRRSDCVRHAATHPVTVVALVAGVGVASSISGLAAVMAAVLVIIAAAWVSVQPWFGRAVVRHLQRRDRRQRRADRARRMLQASSTYRDLLCQLTQIVDTIVTDHGAALATRYELEDLLDRYAELTVCHEQCLQVLRMADRRQLAREVAETSVTTAAKRRHRTVLERRLHHWDECKAREDRLTSELASIAEFVRLIAQKAACPDAELDAGTDLDRRLGDLDEHELAIKQLSDDDGEDRRLLAAPPN